jgi:hypothetical protein
MMRIKKLKPLNHRLNNKISSLVMNSQATELKSGDAGNRSPSRLRSKHERRPAKPKPNGELNRGNTLQKRNAKPKPGAAKPSSHGVKQAAQEQKFEAEMDPRPNRTQPPAREREVKLLSGNPGARYGSWTTESAIAS